MFKRILSLSVVFCFFLTTLGPFPQAHADPILGLPQPGTMVNLSPAYVPVIVKGLRVHPENPILFDFIVDTGNTGLSASSPELKTESEKLIKYFLASLTIPEDDLWVNLSPYEKDRIIPDQLGQTEMGRDMLAEDYMLKQITASLIYPEKNLGKEFWNRVYSKAQEQYGTNQIPVNTFNKVWIVADKAKVYVHANTAFVVASHLKVMLEEDYLAMQKNKRNLVVLTDTRSSLSFPNVSVGNPDTKVHSLASQIIRSIILPELEKEVNTGKNFANLRQIFHSMILAAWYKKNLKEALLNQVYSNKDKINGIERPQDLSPEQIYERYLKAYKKGVFNYIKEDIQNGQTIPRKYFSGGLRIDAAQATEVVQAGDQAVLAFERRPGNLVLVSALTPDAASVIPQKAPDSAMTIGWFIRTLAEKWSGLNDYLQRKHERAPHDIRQLRKKLQLENAKYKGQNLEIASALDFLNEFFPAVTFVNQAEGEKVRIGYYPDTITTCAADLITGLVIFMKQSLENRQIKTPLGLQKEAMFILPLHWYEKQSPEVKEAIHNLISNAFYKEKSGGNYFWAGGKLYYFQWDDKDPTNGGLYLVGDGSSADELNAAAVEFLGWLSNLEKRLRQFKGQSSAAMLIDHVNADGVSEILNAQIRVRKEEYRMDQLYSPLALRGPRGETLSMARLSLPSSAPLLRRAAIRILYNGKPIGEEKLLSEIGPQEAGQTLLAHLSKNNIGLHQMNFSVEIPEDTNTIFLPGGGSVPKTCEFLVTGPAILDAAMRNDSPVPTSLPEFSDGDEFDRQLVLHMRQDYWIDRWDERTKISGLISTINLLSKMTVHGDRIAPHALPAREDVDFVYLVNVQTGEMTATTIDNVPTSNRFGGPLVVRIAVPNKKRTYYYVRSQNDSFLIKAADKAALAVIPEGGIDFNARNMGLDVSGDKIDVHFNKAMIAQFRRGDFSGVRPEILAITPIANVMPLLEK